MIFNTLRFVQAQAMIHRPGITTYCPTYSLPYKTKKGDQRIPQFQGKISAASCPSILSEINLLQRIRAFHVVPAMWATQLCFKSSEQPTSQTVIRHHKTTNEIQSSSRHWFHLVRRLFQATFFVVVEYGEVLNAPIDSWPPDVNTSFWPT